MIGPLSLQKYSALGPPLSLGDTPFIGYFLGDVSGFVRNRTRVLAKKALTAQGAAVAAAVDAREFKRVLTRLRGGR